MTEILPNSAGGQRLDQRLDRIAAELEQVAAELHIAADPHGATRLAWIARTVESEAAHARHVGHGYPPVRARTDLPPGITIGGIRALDAHTAALRAIITGTA